MMKELKFSVLLSIAALCLTACAKFPTWQGDLQGRQRGELLNSRLNVSLSKAEVVDICKDIPDSLQKYGCECWHLDYCTLWKEDTVSAQALLIIPQGVTNNHMALYCHGTNVPISVNNMGRMFSEYAGPGKGRDYEEIYHCSMPLAAAGYCTVVPEYTGFGDTAGREHPFIYAPELCKSIIDALIASKGFLLGKGINIDDDLYISGWSQGGSAALATEKYLERDYPGLFKVRCTSTLSGPHSITAFIKHIFAEPDKFHVTEALYTWAGYVINYFDKGLGRPADQMFKLPIYDQSQALLVAGGTSREVFKDSFINCVMDDTDKAFLAALDSTSYASGWKPKAKVHIHHGTEDPIVPFINAEVAYYGLKYKEGADVELHAYKGKGHFDFVAEYMTNTIHEFREIRGE